jgi:hypothetical protein
LHSAERTCVRIGRQMKRRDDERGCTVPTPQKRRDGESRKPGPPLRSHATIRVFL